MSVVDIRQKIHFHSCFGYPAVSWKISFSCFQDCVYRAQSKSRLIKSTLHAVEYIHTDAQNFLLHVSTLHVYRHKGVLTVVNVVLSKLFVVRSTVTHLHNY